MNKINLFVLLAALVAFANAGTNKDVENDVVTPFKVYTLLQNAYFYEAGNIGSVKETGYSFPRSTAFKYGELSNSKGIFAVTQRNIASCSKGSKWELIPYTEQNGKTLKYKCNVDAACVSLSANLRKFCKVSVVSESKNAKVAPSAADKELAKEVSLSFVTYYKLQQTYFAETENIGSVIGVGFVFPRSTAFKYGELSNSKGIFAVTQRNIVSCSKGSKWEFIPYTEQNGTTLKFKCKVDSGCEDLTPQLKNICDSF